jgi:hypothetical protein
MIVQRIQPPATAWVRIGAADSGRWPEWRRRWLVLSDGRVFIPVPRHPASSEGATVVREGGPHIIANGHVLAEAGWLLERRTGEAATLLRAMVDRVLARAS